jgi:hypothetical protein
MRSCMRRLAEPAWRNDGPPKIPASVLGSAGEGIAASQGTGQGRVRCMARGNSAGAEQGFSRMRRHHWCRRPAACR